VKHFFTFKKAVILIVCLTIGIGVYYLIENKDYTVKACPTCLEVINPNLLKQNAAKSCHTDSDCSLVDKQNAVGYICCGIDQTQNANYSEAKWTAVNKDWYQQTAKIACSGKTFMCPAKFSTATPLPTQPVSCIKNSCTKQE
jgi:hypothetical protein